MADELRGYIADLFSQFSGQEAVLIIPRPYLTVCDNDHRAALLLSQCVYWSDRTQDAEGWFAKSYIDWFKELGLSEYEVRRAAKALAGVGLETMLKKFNGAPVVHYRINKSKFSESILKKLQNPILRNSSIDPEETQESLTYITTENTTDIKPPAVEEAVKDSESNLDSETQTVPAVVRPNIFKLYEDLCGMIRGGLIVDELKDLQETYPEDWILAAFKEATLQNIRKLAYVKGILQRWKVEGKNAPRPDKPAPNPSPPLRAVAPKPEELNSDWTPEALADATRKMREAKAWIAGGSVP